MKLIIQIPCYNEAKTLPHTLRDLPKKIKGIKKIQTQIIDDGSSDNTSSVATRYGVDYIVKFTHHKGLAAAFKAGVENALKKGADILVNTDGDNQYRGADIGKLVAPIVNRQADVVVGSRPIKNHPEFSWIKKKLQKLGSFILRQVSQTDVIDATSGFRAYNHEALLHMNMFSKFSYCMETLIQAGYNNLKVTSVKVRVNKKTRPSRLYRNMIEYLWRSGMTIISIGWIYRSTQFFTFIAFIFGLAAIGLVLRFLWKITYLGSTAATFWPTIVFAGILVVISIQLILTGIISSMISSNRKLMEQVLYKQKKREVEDGKRRKR